MVFPILIASLLAAAAPDPTGTRLDAAAVLEQFPLRKGARWVFEGEASWPGRKAGQVRTGKVRDVMEVLQVVPGKDAFAAVVRGFPMDLAWYQPGTRPRISVLVCKGGRFYQRPSQGLKPALALARELLADGSWPPPEEDPFLDLPLADAKTWGHAPRRGDGLYRWVVDAKAPRSFPGAGGGPRPVFTASFTTNPDEVVLEFSPGVGITAFTYEHHGALARTRVRLVGLGR